MFDLPVAAVLYCAIIAIVFVGLWLWYDRRDHQRFEAERRRGAFHCIRCDRLYAAPAGTAVSPCPRCGHENARLKF